MWQQVGPLGQVHGRSGTAWSPPLHWIDAAELACTNFCCFHGGPWADRCEYEPGNGDEKTLKREIFTMNSCEFSKA